MDYRKTAQDILDHVGGSKNIASAAHCATRLRLVIADNKKVSKEALENVDGVKGVFEASGQLQIILGTGTVNKVFAEFIDIAGITASSKAEAKEAAAEKQNWFMRAIKLLGDIFVPIIPAIVASGFLMGIMNSLDFMNSNGFLHINTHSSIYVFANLFSNIAYTFLQILIAFSAAKAFGANQYLGAVIGMIMIHPSLQNAYTVATEGVQQTQSVFFGLFKIDMVGYQGHVIPVIIAVWILAVIEKKLHKIVPEVLDLFVTPLVSVFVTGYLTLSIVGPIFVWAENAILGAIQWMLTLPLGIGSLIMGGLYAPTVVTGIHQMYTAIDIGQLAKYGVTYWLPLASAANVAQGAAALLGEYKLSEYHLWDYGFDYYAPQSFETEDGRRIHISWMGMPDCEEYSNPTIQTGWQHCFTFPREIFEKDGKICQRPIRELEEKKHLVSDVKGMLVREGYPVCEMTISDITKNRFKVILSEKLILDYADGKFRMHFTDQDKTSVSSGRSMRYVEVEEVENLKILADTSSVEVFVNDGEYVFSTRYYPEVYKLQAEAVGAQITLSEIM